MTLFRLLILNGAMRTMKAGKNTSRLTTNCKSTNMLTLNLATAR